MRKNQLPFLFILLLGSLLLLVGCEIPSPNAEAPVPVNPDSVPSQNLVPTQSAEDMTDGSSMADDATSEDGATETGGEGGDAAGEGETGESPPVAGDAGGTDGTNSEGATNAAAGEQPAAGGDGGAAATDNGAPADTAQQTPTETPREPWNYAVQPGDTFGSIAERNGISMDELQAANNLTNIHSLDVGQVLVIPVPGVPVEQPAAAEQTETQPQAEETVHVVVFGDTLYSIGQRYGFTVEELQVHNGILDATRIDIGQEIRIPAR